MLGVILNESEVVKGYLENNEIDKNPMVSVGLLIKYYFLKDMDDENIYTQIMTYLEGFFKEKFVFTKWDMPVRNSIKRFKQDVSRYKINVKMNDVGEIQITENELSVIGDLENLMLEKIAFIMLVYGKIANIQMDSTEGWINKSCSVICKEAKVSLRGIEQQRIFNELYKKQYIKMSNNNTKTNMKVNYFDEDSEVGISINNFEGVVYYYLIWKGENWKRCECCNKKWFKLKGVKDNSKKYCNGCAKEQNIVKTLENRKKFESKQSL